MSTAKLIEILENQAGRRRPPKKIGWRCDQCGRFLLEPNSKGEIAGRIQCPNRNCKHINER